MAHFFVFGGVGELGKAISIKRNGLNNNKTHHFTKHDGPLPSLLFVHSPAIPSVVVFPRTCRPTRIAEWKNRWSLIPPYGNENRWGGC